MQRRDISDIAPPRAHSSAPPEAPSPLSTSQQPATPAAKAAHRLHPGVLATAVICFSVWVVVSIGSFTFANDDIYVFTVARQGGLNGHLLALELFSHFAPFNRFLHWLALRISPLNVAVGFAIGAILVAGMLAAYLWLLRELRISWQRQAVAVAACALGVTLVAIGTWWGEVIHIPPSLAFIFLVLAAHVRALRLRSWRWHVGSVGLLGVGFLTQERTLYAPAFAVALDLFVLWRDEPLREAARRVWTRAKWPLLAMFLVSAGAGAFVIKRYFAPQPTPHLHDVLLLFPVSFFEYFVPSLFGFYRPSVPMPVWISVLVAVSVLATLMIASRRNVKPLAFFAVAYLLYYGLLAVGRLGTYPVEVEASDLQYAAYVVPFLVLALVAARWPSLPGGTVVRVARGVVLGGLAVCLVAGSVAFTRLTPGMQSRQAAATFLTTLRASQPQWAAQSVLPLRVPQDVAATWMDPYGREQSFLQLLDKGYRAGVLRPGTRWVVIDDHAGVHPAALTSLVTLSAAEVQTTAQPGPGIEPMGNACYRATSPGNALVVPLPRTVSWTTGAPLMLAVSYDSPSGTVLTFAASPSAGIWQYGALPQGLPGDAHAVATTLEGETAMSVALVNVMAGSSICLHSLSLGVPVVAAADGACREVGLYGAPGTQTACPAGLSRTIPAQDRAASDVLASGAACPGEPHIIDRLCPARL